MKSSSAQLAAHYSPQHRHGIRAEHFAPLQEFRQVEPAIPRFNPSHIAVGSPEPAREFPLSHVCLFPNLYQDGHDAPMPG